MIIINQEKSCVVNTDNTYCIILRKIGSKFFIIANFGIEKEVPLGTYSTQENAQSVLKRVIEMLPFAGNVFYMPEEE